MRGGPPPRAGGGTARCDPGPWRGSRLAPVTRWRSHGLRHRRPGTGRPPQSRFPPLWIGWSRAMALPARSIRQTIALSGDRIRLKRSWRRHRKENSRLAETRADIPPEFCERYLLAAFASGGVIVDLATGNYFRVNRTAATIC